MPLPTTWGDNYLTAKIRQKQTCIINYKYIQHKINTQKLKPGIVTSSHATSDLETKWDYSGKIRRDGKARK